MPGHTALQLSEDEERAQQARYSSRAAVAQRVGWVVLALIIVGALAGLFGPGPLSWSTVSTPRGSIEVAYERFARHIGDSNLELRMQPDPKASEVAVWISSDYLAGVQVQQVQPQPDSWTARDGGVVLSFPVADADTVTVQIQIRPDKIGMLRAQVGVPGDRPVSFWQFIYP